MKAAVVLFVVFAVVVVLEGVDVQRHRPGGDQSKNVKNRLIKFNETTTVWMSQEEVDEMAKSECGAGRGFMDITDFPNLEASPRNLHAIPINPAQQAIVNRLSPLLSKNAISDTITYLSTSFTTRYYQNALGKQASDWLLSQYRAYATNRRDITFSAFPHTFVQPSYIVRMEGSDETLKDEVVVIGSHIDSISSSAAAPGADDDASGTATVLEIFRVLATNNFVPRRTIEFHGYAGEEAGLLGSQAIVSAYTRDNVDVVSMLQLDMTGYVRPDLNPTVGIVNDFTEAKLTQFVRRLTETYTTSTWTNTTCGYGCSDHASWNRAGYVSAFPFEGRFSDLNPNIHTIGDLIGVLDLDHALNFAKIGLAYCVELSMDSTLNEVVVQPSTPN